MYLKKINLFNYKNFAEATFEFDTKINCFVGKNGIGKTNVLDAIYHLSYGKSYFNPLAIQNIKHGEEFFVIDAEFEKNDRNEQIVCSLKKGQKKILKRNGKQYDKFSDHIGFIPLVIISPADRDLIVEGSETRRKFIDSVISQSDSNYLQNLIKYQKVLNQRNALLKYFALNQVFENDTLSIYNEQLHELGQSIFEKRKQFLEDFIPIFNTHHHAITGSEETVQLVYESQLFDKNLITLLQENINKDRVIHYTTVGIHKDDLSFEIDNFPIKKFGSQGQQKSFLIALKLAQYQYLQNRKEFKPMLLLDDIFDKLDDKRTKKLMQMVSQDSFGQLFISHTNSDKIKEVFGEIECTLRIFSVENGRIKNIENEQE